MKHYKQEYENFAKYRSQAMIEKIIPALDSFQMAFSLPATTKETENYRIGFEFILRQLKDALENEGVIEIAPVVGNKFDHNVHSAVESVETEDEKLVGTIQSVRLNGYKLKDRLIRPATVVVYVLKVVKEEVAKDEVSVIITKTPCVLLDKSKKPVYVAHSDKCKKCGMCMKPGCPAMTKNSDGTIRIDDTMCTGCGLCETLCKFDAIELLKAGDK